MRKPFLKLSDADKKEYIRTSPLAVLQLTLSWVKRNKGEVGKLWAVALESKIEKLKKKEKNYKKFLWNKKKEAAI